MMSRTRFFVLASITLGLAGGPWTTESAGQVVPGVHNLAQGDTYGDSTLDSAALLTGKLRSTFLNAYSLQANGPVTGTNLSRTTSLTSGGKMPMPQPTSKIIADKSIAITHTGAPGGPPKITLKFSPYASVFYNGSTNQPKSLISQNLDYESIDSTSGVYKGYAEQFQTFKGVRGIFAYGIDNSLTGKESGQAAGEARDPMYLPAGTALPYQIEIDVDLNSDLPNLLTAVNYYALDSNTDPGDDNPDTTDYPGQIDDFMDDDNAETLWTVALSSTGVTSGPGSIAVDFELNAASELSFSSQELTDLSCTGANDNDACIDNAVDSELEGDLVSDGSGGEYLNDVSLFQDAVTYTPSGSAGSTVEYGEGVAAGVATVPEPPTIALLLVSIAVFGILNRRRSLAAPAPRDEGRAN